MTNIQEKRFVGRPFRRGFSLIEVIVALAMLALIAVPAMGLATMAVSRSKEQLTTGQASELKGRIDTALRVSETVDILDADYDVSSSGKTFWASEDLMYIEPGDAASTENDKYYKVVLKEPNDYTYSTDDPYRLVVYEVTWPENTTTKKRNQIFFTSVFRK